ncbi:MAG: hypothetical protein Q9170_003797 [Blastenia crenularia]
MSFATSKDPFQSITPTKPLEKPASAIVVIAVTTSQARSDPKIHQLSFNQDGLALLLLRPRCKGCLMVTDDISRQSYNIRLRSEWEAEETYNFNRFHVPGCKQETCDGKCGLKDKKKLWDEIRQRQAHDKESKKRESESTDSKEDEKLKEKMEEPGDTPFVAKSRMKPNERSATPKGQKKVVKFAD